MAYEKQNFIPGQKLKAAELNHMEDGIVNAVSVTEQTLSEAQKSQARKNLDLDDIAGAHIGPEAPTNGEKLWIDTDEEAEEGTQLDGPAAVGQVFIVTEVDENGKPTKYKWVDLPKAETPDWNAAEGEAGHVLNRTHYSEFVEGAVIFPEDTVAWDESTEFVGMVMLTAPLIIGNTYKVKFNGAEYVCKAFDYAGGMPTIGNLAYLMSDGEDTGEPFAIMYTEGIGMLIGYDMANTEEFMAGSAVVSITEGTEIIQKIPNKFLDKDFRINVTVDVLSGTNIVDKTFNEIRNAHRAGKNITLVHNAAGVFEYVYVLSYISDERAAFMSLGGDEGINNTNGILRLAVVGYGNSFSTYTANISMMKVNND